MCYGEPWTVESDGLVRFGCHEVRLTPEGALAGRTTHGVRLYYVREARLGSTVIDRSPRKGPSPSNHRNVPANPPAELRIIKRRHNVPTIVTAFFDLGEFQKGAEGVRGPQTYRKWMHNFARIENPLVFFVEQQADAQFVHQIRRSCRHATRVIEIERTGLRVFSQVDRVAESIRNATFAKASPNTTVAEYSCVQHAKYELLLRAITSGWVGTAYCCWMDCGKIFDSLEMADRRLYQLQHRSGYDSGIHYTEARPFQPLALVDIQAGEGGAGEFCYAGGFFYGAAEPMSKWCATYLEHALRYQAAGYVFTDQSTIHAMLSEGLVGGVTAHRFKDSWFGLCHDLLRPVEAGP